MRLGADSCCDDPELLGKMTRDDPKKKKKFLDLEYNVLRAQPVVCCAKTNQALLLSDTAVVGLPVTTTV